MKAISEALAVVSFLVLLHLLVCSSPSVSGAGFIGERIQPRRLLQPLDLDSANGLKNISRAARMPVRAINAGLRKLPPTKSNPTQN